MLSFIGGVYLLSNSEANPCLNHLSALEDGVFFVLFFFKECIPGHTHWLMQKSE